MLSYIIPAKDEEKYIGDCVASIFAQKVSEPIEVIVVDNASTDGTSARVRNQFPLARVVIESRSGINFARQKGFEASSGDFVIFIDADIRLPQDWTARVVARLRADPALVAVSGAYRYYDAAAWYLNPVTRFYQLIFHVWAAAANKIIGRHRVLIAGDMAIKRPALEQVGGFDTRFIFYREDVDTAKRLTKIGRIEFRYQYWVNASARRFNKVGLLKMTALYFYHFLAGAVSKKPAGGGYDSIR